MTVWHVCRLQQFVCGRLQRRLTSACNTEGCAREHRTHPCQPLMFTPVLPCKLCGACIIIYSVDVIQMRGYRRRPVGPFYDATAFLRKEAVEVWTQDSCHRAVLCHVCPIL